MHVYHAFYMVFAYKFIHVSYYIYTAGARWCFPQKNPLRDMFCDFQRVFPTETQKVFLSGFP